mmetsp:Transcript_10377/g.26607  ORF Transcript_10377/g.26607 Transcript_10377/m.26607 type:complete len:229 (-) Transcript_10377:175-861(-)
MVVCAIAPLSSSIALIFSAAPSSSPMSASTQCTSFRRCPRMASSMRSSLPEPCRPASSMDCPQPSGASVSTAATPVNMLSLIWPRSSMLGDLFSSGILAPLSSCPLLPFTRPMKFTMLPSVPSTGICAASYLRFVTAPSSSSITCSTPWMLHCTGVPSLMPDAPPKARMKQMLSLRRHRSTPRAPEAKDTTVPGSASLLRPSTMTRSFSAYSTLPRDASPSICRSVAS